MKIEYLLIDELVPYQNNTRTHSKEQVDQIAASITEFGFNNPIIIDSNNGLIAGHGRLLAAKKLKMLDVPVIKLTHLTEAQKTAFIIADNKLALNAGWDEDLLKIELEKLKELDFDINLIGFDDDELSKLLKLELNGGLTDPDDMPEIPVNPISKMGDVWVLGTHRLKCGDSTVFSDLEHCMGGVKADACWTDPPYNVNYEGKAGKIKNDRMIDQEFNTFLKSAFTCVYNVLKPGSVCYVAHADKEGFNFTDAFKQAGFKLSGCLIWVKNQFTLGRSDYQIQHEPILYGWKPGASHRWYGDRKQKSLVELNNDALVVNEDGSITVKTGKDIFVLSGEKITASTIESTVIKVAKPLKSSEHPTMKPTELITKMLYNSTRSGDIVLDIFGGSGSTLMACEMTGRIARIMELDEKFVDVIVKRWQDYTGKDAHLEANGMTYNQLSSN